MNKLHIIKTVLARWLNPNQNIQSIGKLLAPLKAIHIEVFNCTTFLWIFLSNSALSITLIRFQREFTCTLVLKGRKEKKNVAENHRQSWNSLNSFSSGRKIDSVARNSIYSAACFLDQHGFRNLGKFDAFKQNSMMLHEDIFNRSKFRSWCKTDGRYFMCDKLENHRNRMNGYWWDSPEIDF